MSAEPTAEQIARADKIVDAAWYDPDNSDGLEVRLIRVVAALLAERDRALAAAVTAEREKYLRVADELDVVAESQNAEASRDFDRGDQIGGTNLTGQYYATAHAARRIREVSS